MPTQFFTKHDWRDIYTNPDNWGGDDWRKTQFNQERMAATRTLTSLTNDRSTEYSRYFSPVAKNLAEVARSPFDPKVGQEAADRSGKLFDVSSQALEREQRALGTGPVRGQERRLNLRRAIAQVDGANRAIDAADERQSLAQMFSMDQYSDLMGAAGQMYGQLSQMEASRRAQFSQAKAATRASLMSLGGTAAGIAAMTM